MICSTAFMNHGLGSKEKCARKCADALKLFMLIMQGIEKPVASKMLEKGSNRLAFAVDRHAGMVSHPQPVDPVRLRYVTFRKGVFGWTFALQHLVSSTASKAM